MHHKPTELKQNKTEWNYRTVIDAANIGNFENPRSDTYNLTFCQSSFAVQFSSNHLKMP